MKRIGITISLLLLLFGANASDLSSDRSLKCYHVMDSLLSGRCFFSARDYYAAHKGKMGEFHQLLSEAVLDNAFNRVDLSNQKIEKLFRTYGGQLSDSVKGDLYEIKQSNHFRLCEYGKAYEAQSIFVKNFIQHKDEKGKKSEKNIEKLWKLLVDKPKQVVEIDGDTRIPTVHDQLGLLNLLVGNGKDSMFFVFDTGANLSTITESKAAQFGITYSDSTVDIGSVSGIHVKAHIGVCPLLTFGKIRVRNAVFIVFPDSAMYIAPAKFQLNGILGFPVFNALKEIQITQGDELFVPRAASRSGEQNMALSGLAPFICLDGDTYTFDSGASTSMLYEAYYKKHKNEIEAMYKERDCVVTGAGGSRSTRGYSIIFTPTIGKERVRLSGVDLLKKNMMPNCGDIYGNIGQDLIKKFYKMTISFENMFIKLE